MDRKAQLFARVKDGTDNLRRLLDDGINFPIEKYTDPENIKAIAASLSIAPEDWVLDDLEKILLIRDGLYSIREKLRDDNDGSEHSIDQIIYYIDRVYVDVEFALRSIDDEVLITAQGNVAALHRGAQIEKAYVAKRIEPLDKTAKELLVQTNNTYRRIEINFFKIENSSINIDILKKAKLQIQRLSASVFAIKLSLEKSTIFQGVFQFLNDSADRIVDELRNFAESIKGVYDKASNFIQDIENIADHGGRFTKQISNFIKSIFGESHEENGSSVSFEERSGLSGAAVLATCQISEEDLLLGCRDGSVLVFSVRQARLMQKYRPVSEAIHNITLMSDGRIALGTEVGLDVFNPNSSDRRQIVEHASAKERVTACVMLPDGRSLVTGSREGKLRKWSVATSLHAATRGIDQNKLKDVRIGKNIRKILLNKNDIVVGCSNEIQFADFELQIKRTVQTGIQTEDMILLNSGELLICGSNQIAQLNLEKGIYSRLLSAAPNKNYTCLAAMSAEIFCAGTSEGEILAINLKSNEEVGSFRVPFPVRSLECIGSQVFVAGGAWHNGGLSASLLSWQRFSNPVQL